MLTAVAVAIAITISSEPATKRGHSGLRGARSGSSGWGAAAAACAGGEASEGRRLPCGGWCPVGGRARRRLRRRGRRRGRRCRSGAGRLLGRMLGRPRPQPRQGRLARGFAVPQRKRVGLDRVLTRRESRSVIGRELGGQLLLVLLLGVELLFELIPVEGVGRIGCRAARPRPPSAAGRSSSGLAVPPAQVVGGGTCAVFGPLAGLTPEPRENRHDHPGEHAGQARARSPRSPPGSRQAREPRPTRPARDARRPGGRTPPRGCPPAGRRPRRRPRRVRPRP